MLLKNDIDNAQTRDEQRHVPAPDALPPAPLLPNLPHAVDAQSRAVEEVSVPASAVDEAPHAAQRAAEHPSRRGQQGPREQVLEEADGAPGRADCAGQEGRCAQRSLREGVELVRWPLEELPPLGEGEEGVVGGEEFGEGGEGGEDVADEGREAGGRGWVEGCAGEEGVGWVGGGCYGCEAGEGRGEGGG